MGESRLKETGSTPEICRERPHRGRERTLIEPNAEHEQIFSQWEAMFLFKIVNSTYIKNRLEHRTYWCPRDALINEFDEPTYKQLGSRRMIQEWAHPDGFAALTLTPLSAYLLGVRLGEYWVRHYERVQEYRGLRRRSAWIRVQRWDTESYWTYRSRPERSIRIPGNTCELPLIGDPEDKSPGKGPEYLEDWETWTYTKNPKRAIGFTIRVGSFTHHVLIERDRRRKKPRKS